MRKQIDVAAKLDSFEQVRRFIEQILQEERVTSEVINENILVIEEVFVRIAENYEVDDEIINITVSEAFGEIKVFLKFSGERFNIDFNNGDIYDPGAIILSKYEDKIGLKYRKRDNTIRIIARRRFDKIGRWSIIGIALALIVYAAVSIFLSKEQQAVLDSEWIKPLENMFASGILLIAAPVTFLSLVTNITNVAVLVDNRLQISSLVKKIARTSITSILIALVYYLILKATIGRYVGMSDAASPGNISGTDAKEIFFNFIPDNLLGAFDELLPFQIIILGVFTAAGIISCNKHFDAVKVIFDALYALACRMLGIIMLFLPAAAFLSFLDMLLFDGARELLKCGLLILIILFGMIIIVAIRLIFMKAKGVPAITVLRRCWPAIIENFRINSPIDAVPYNTRFCNKEFGVRMEKLDLELPVFAEISLGGNCYIISLVTLILFQYAGLNLGPFEIAIILLIVLGLSLGAPNQAGSVLVGLMVMAKFTQIDITFMCTVIYCEVFFSRVVSVLNALSDISSEILDVYMENKHAGNKL